LMFLCAYRLSRSLIVSALAALAFVSCRQIYLPDLARIDHLIFAVLILAIYCSIAILQDGLSRWAAIVVGCTTGAFLSCKANGSYVVAFPALAVLLRSPPLREYPRFAITAATACGATLALLMFRYILHASEILQTVKQKLWAQIEWAEMVGKGATFYYNFDIFSSNGASYMFPSDLPPNFEWIPWLWVVAGIMIVLCLPFLTIVTQRREALYFPILLALFSLIGLFAYKYPRGGYHLVPIYILGSVHCVAVARDNGRQGLTVAATGALSVIALVSTADFVRELRLTDERIASLRTSRFEARDWLATHICPGARLCTWRGGAWGNPPLEGLSFRIVPSALDIPYTHKDELSRYDPPSLDVLKQQCDLVILNDFIKYFIVTKLRNTGFETLAVRWSTFFTDLTRKNVPLFFGGTLPIYGSKQIEICILNSSAQSCVH
jgi:hypothetical protein